MNDLKEQILQLLRQRGPLVPNDLKKVIGGDSMILGAVLSEMVSRGMVKITKLKKGASPFYYLPSQDSLLEKLIEFLNPKDQNTVRLLQEEKVIQEASQNMLTRVSLRNIPDFVREFMVQTKEGPYRFWRYYLISENQAMELLRNRFNPKEEKPLAEKKSVEQSVKETNNSSEQTVEIKDEIKSDNHTDPINEKKDESKKTESQQTPKKEITKQIKNSIKHSSSEKQKHLSIEPSLEKTPFYEKVINYFNENEIVLESEEQISKDREYYFIVKIPTAVGYLKMFCSSRNKKKLTQGDVAPALLKAKTKDLPCIFLTNGEFSKKSLELMNKEYLGLIIKHI